VGVGASKKGNLKRFVDGDNEVAICYNILNRVSERRLGICARPAANIIRSCMPMNPQPSRKKPRKHLPRRSRLSISSALFRVKEGRQPLFSFSSPSFSKGRGARGRIQNHMGWI
jgi:hypothetical protein